MHELQANQVRHEICADGFCMQVLLYCFWYLQMNSTAMKQIPHLNQKIGQQRSSVFPKQFLGLEVAPNTHQYPLLDDRCDWVRLNVHHLPNQWAQDSAHSNF